LAPVVVPCVPIPEGPEGPELALLDEVPVPAPELAAEPALAPAAPPPAPPPPPPPPWANAVDETAIQVSATSMGFRIMDGLPCLVDNPWLSWLVPLSVRSGEISAIVVLIAPRTRTASEIRTRTVAARSLDKRDPKCVWHLLSACSGRMKIFALSKAKNPDRSQSGLVVRPKCKRLRARPCSARAFFS
jgi:hypothetical protein